MSKTWTQFTSVAFIYVAYIVACVDIKKNTYTLVT